MNDAQIRESFHRKRLRRYHEDPDTLVVDELGLKHGRCRADITVINGHLIGYEIKSDVDSLRRLDEQIKNYSDVFDRATLVVGENHLPKAQKLIPEWWGIICATEGRRESVHFETVSTAKINPSVDDFSVAQLLWRNEAQEVLVKLGFTGKLLRQKRSDLYRALVDSLGSHNIRNTVRECLKNRRNWRCHEPLSQCDG